MMAKLRQQGGALVVTVPSAIALQMGWRAGNTVDIETVNDTVVLRSGKRQPRGRKTVATLLAGIDRDEIAQLNEQAAGFSESRPQGKEVW